MKTFIRDAAITLGLAVAIFLVCQSILYQCVVHQTSMMPNIIEGQRIFVNKTAYSFKEPKRGDIIVFRQPGVSDATPLIKRVIGLPGEVVFIEKGNVYIDGEPLTEPYLYEVPDYMFAAYEVPENHYFVLGDARNTSYDSHYGWTVDREVIIGKAWLSVWPLDMFGFAPNYVFADN